MQIYNPRQLEISLVAARAFPVGLCQLDLLLLMAGIFSWVYIIKKGPGAPRSHMKSCHDERKDGLKLFCHNEGNEVLHKEIPRIPSPFIMERCWGEGESRDLTEQSQQGL